MKFPIGTLVATMILAGTLVQVQAAERPDSKAIRVETPANHPELAQEGAQALYLHIADDGRSLLYVEKENGSGLAVLDVTDPARIRRVADTEFSAPSAFDFVRNVGDNAVLVRYRDGSGFALMNLKHSRHPVLAAAPEFAQAETYESLGETGLLVAVAQTRLLSPIDATTYRVLDTAYHSAPMALATIPAVSQHVENSETGTLFLLNSHGVTAVRRLRVEQEHQAELTRERGN